MPLSRTRLVNPRLGIYFGIFTSAYTALVLVLLIFEQLGASDSLIRHLMLAGPLVFYVAIGAVTACSEPIDFFASGRRVPPFFNGLVLSIGALGATGIVAGTGLLFINGFDAWFLVIAFTGGFVVMAILIAPYLRKFGALTVPSYLGRRCDSRLVRLTIAAIAVVPMLLVVAAEVRMGVFAGKWLTGQSEQMVATILAVTVICAIVLGGVRSSSWANSAESIAVLLALFVPVAMVATAVTNLPFAQLSHGPVLRSLVRLENQQGIPIPILSPLAFEIAGAEVQAIAQRMTKPFGSIGPLSFVFASLTLMAGVASAPWLLPRSGTTLTVYDTRKSLGWATFLVGTIMVTASSVAVFMRDVVMDTLVGHSASQLPDWFRSLEAMGFAAVHGQVPRLPVSSFSFHRDAVLFALPIAHGFPSVFLYLALAGAFAAAVAAVSLSSLSLGTLLSEDLINGLKAEPARNKFRLMLARGCIALAVIIGVGIALIVPADPLWLVLWALALSASAFFPILVLSIWWKRLSAFGTACGALAGFAVTALVIVAGEASLGLSGALAAVLGMPAGFAAAVAGSYLRPSSSPKIVELVEDLRVPGGETIYDRETRLLRLRQRSRPL